MFTCMTIVWIGCSQPSGELNSVEASGDTPKPASEFTRSANSALMKYLSFNDSTDFVNARRGFIATLDSGMIRNTEGRVVYNTQAYDFVKGTAPATANPSLWRQSRLNSFSGLFEVTKGIYQVRNFDLANMTLVAGNKGWIIIDPLGSAELSKAGLDLANKKLGKRPVTAIIFTHSHGDHYGGINGVLSEQETNSNKIPVFVPKGFLEHAVSEFVMGGNTMGRRAAYMYGNLLPKNETGTLGAGLGQTTGTGAGGLLDGTDIIDEPLGESRVIDGKKVEFVYTPESEAPAEMMFYFYDYKALCQAENISHTLHNLYTLRGAQVRNGQKWSEYIDRVIAKWGDQVEFSFGSHHWPTWDNGNIRVFWENQRDLYRFIHDQTLRLANNGYTPIEIANMLQLPEALDKQFYNRGYYGTLSHDIRAQYQLYFGWFDGVPAHLNQLPPAEAGKKYVEFIGGSSALLGKAKKSFDAGEYRWVSEVVSHLVFAEPENTAARRLLADAYEQLGYQAESGPWRNFYLSGAQELRHGVKEFPVPNTVSPEVIQNMSLELLFNYLAMRFNGTDAETARLKYNFNLTFPDTKEKATLIISNGVVNPRIGSHVSRDVTATLTVNRSDLNKVVSRTATFNDLIANGTIKVTGDADAFRKVMGRMDDFKFWFNIITLDSVLA